MRDTYDLRPEPLKCKQLYNNALQSFINFEDLMKPKEEVMRHESSCDIQRFKE
ncbi:hypothetical protein HMPREF0372_01494 [Flavonifractor plautii ATCC 29863]|jgi:hypothetical protein|uniref:Uncharacterized protein n=1 Tax=Flavonifractor plautii ATCC 29863 TaxID=411475 RepID=G9YPQ5_FLAPL|nr:hypothetical protein HMPREF0372_01494 [Flavonifractor plautii ATCC 29863]